MARAASEDQRSLYDALCDASRAEDLPICEKCKAWVTWLEGYRKLAAVQPADRFLRLLYTDPRLISYSGEPELMVLYEQARLYQRNSWCGLYGFLQLLERAITGGELSAGAFKKVESAVKIITMHTSKGLEYPVVFLCGCGKGFNTLSLEENLLFHRNLPAAARLYNAEAASNESGILREISKLEIQAEEAEENLRLLYVALTRARERLYVTGTPREKHDKLMDQADRFLRGSRYSILYNGTFMRWILGALREKTVQNRDDPIPYQYVAVTDELKPADPIKSVEENSSSEPQIEPIATGLYSEFQAVLERKADFEYTLEGLNEIPTKIAASKLHTGILDRLADQEDDHTLRLQLELMQSVTPSFESVLTSKKQANAAEIGTATHSFLEFCDLEALPREGVSSEIDRLIAQQFILPETAELLNLEQLEAFAKSDLMELLQDAAEIYREQHFSLPIPISSLTSSSEKFRAYREKTVFVQGSIDLLLRTKEGKLILFDYKTDRLSEEERNDRQLLTDRMIQKHGDQLSCYAKAVQKLFGRAPDQVYIYSFPLGESVLIPVDPAKF